MIDIAESPSPLLDAGALEVMVDPAILSGPDLRVVAMNGAAAGLFGRHGAEQFPEDLLSLVQPEHVPMVADALLRGARGRGGTVALRAAVRCHDGATELELRIAPLFDNDGALEGYLLTLPRSAEGTILPESGGEAPGEIYADLVRQVAELLDVQCVVLGRLEGDPSSHVTTIATWLNGRPGPALRYALEHTPCAEVLGGRACHYPERVQQLFPRDLLLQELGMEGYLGATVVDGTGRPVGILALLHRATLYRPNDLLGTVQRFAARAGRELERERQRQVLLHSEHRWLEAMRTMADGLIEIEHGRGEIAFSPPCAARLGPRPPSIAAPAGLEALWDRVHPDDLPTVRRALEPAGGALPTLPPPFRLLASDGEYRWFEARGSHHDGVTGRPERTLILLTDVTAASRQRILLDQIRQVGQLSGWSYDIELDRFDLMPELTPIDGIDAEEIVGVLRDPEALLGAADAEQARTAFAAAASSGTAWDYSYSRVLPDGRTVWRRSLARVELRRGTPSRIHGALQDITARCLLEQQLLQSQKMEALGLLAGGVAHDVNNVLMTISGLRELVTASLPPSHAGQQDLADIGRSVESARRLTCQLLAFARQQVLEPETLSVAAVVEETCSLLRRLLPQTIELECRMPATLPPVRADRAQLEQVLINLALNARDAMPGGGQLQVTAGPRRFERAAPSIGGERPAGDYVEVTVRDSGTGMPPAILARIFEPFFTTKERGRGTGLGLPTSLGIVQQMGGHMTVESEPGTGTRFTFWLPPTKAEPVAPPAAAPPSDAVPDTTILLLEDEPAVRRVTTRILTRHGYTVRAAATGEEALRLAAESPEGIGLLITDVSLPGLPAAATLSALQERYPLLPVLFTSGHGAEAARALGGFDPAHSFLPKPYTIEELLRTVREVLLTSP